MPIRCGAIRKDARMSGSRPRQNVRRPRAVAILLAIAGVLLFASAPPAGAAVLMTVATQIPAVAGTPTVGQTNVVSTMTITHVSNGAEAAQNIALQQITLTASCGAAGVGGLCQAAD